jgi:hypothetical protein
MGDNTPTPAPDNGVVKLDMELLQIKDTTETHSKPDKPSTLFPKITGKVDELVSDYNYKLRVETGVDTLFGKLNTVIKLIGTVKLHGAHADI